MSLIAWIVMWQYRVSLAWVVTQIQGLALRSLSTTYLTLPSVRVDTDGGRVNPDDFITKIYC